MRIDDSAQPDAASSPPINTRAVVIEAQTLRGKTMELSKAASDVIEERRRQQDAEGWTVEHDDAHTKGELSRAGGSYAVNAGAAIFYNGGGDTSVCDTPPYSWPWASEWWKPTNSRRDLVKAGALILAELERLDRMVPNA